MQRNTLSFVEMKAVVEWLTLSWKDIKDNTVTPKAAASACSKAVGFEVTEGNIKRAIKNAEIGEEWPQKRSSVKGRVSDLERRLDRLNDALVSANHRIAELEKSVFERRKEFFK